MFLAWSLGVLMARGGMDPLRPGACGEGGVKIAPCCFGMLARPEEMDVGVPRRFVLAWPSCCETNWTSRPWSMRMLAKVWRQVCGVTSSTPAAARISQTACSLPSPKVLPTPLTMTRSSSSEKRAAIRALRRRWLCRTSGSPRGGRLRFEKHPFVALDSSDIARGSPAGRSPRIAVVQAGGCERL